MESYTRIPTRTFQEELVEASSLGRHVNVRDSRGHTMVYVWLEDDRLRIRHPLGDYEVAVEHYVLKDDRLHAEGYLEKDKLSLTIKRSKDGLLQGKMVREHYSPCDVYVRNNETNKTTLVEPFVLGDPDVYVGCRLFCGGWCTFEGYTSHGLCIVRDKTSTRCVPVAKCRKNLVINKESKLKYLKQRETIVQNELEKLRVAIATLETGS